MLNVQLAFTNSLLASWWSQSILLDATHGCGPMLKFVKDLDSGTSKSDPDRYAIVSFTCNVPTLSAEAGDIVCVCVCVRARMHDCMDPIDSMLFRSCAATH